MTHTVFTWAGTAGFACPSATETKLVAINPLQITKPQSRRRISLFSHSAKKNSHHLAWRSLSICCCGHIPEREEPAHPIISRVPHPSAFCLGRDFVVVYSMPGGCLPSSPLNNPTFPT